MILERFESPGLAHYSYLVGDRGQALVIDPRRDPGIYLERALDLELRITDVLETHRHEDFVSGARELGELTGASVWHADSHLVYLYGRPVEDGQEWSAGRLLLRAVASPGHTPGSMSYLLKDVTGVPWILFSGDSLFAGDVGRVDLAGPGQIEEMAALLHETLFARLLPLGDQLILAPAHGAGSACGSSIADRPWTTIGLERRASPRLQATGQREFVRAAGRNLPRPPYFTRMETLNVTGAPPWRSLPVPAALEARTAAERADGGLFADTRLELGFGAAHVPGALSVWRDGLGKYGGWFLPFDQPIALVCDGEGPGPALECLRWMGYDNVDAYLAGGMAAWHRAGLDSRPVSMVTVHELCRYLDAGEDAWILDVRDRDELESEGRIEGAHHLPLTRLPEELHRVPFDRSVYIFCGTGRRSMLAASYLIRMGRLGLAVVLGGTAGWGSKVCPIAV